MAEKPSFFYDHSEKDEVECLLDFYLSFTLRCSIDNHPKINPLVNKYSKQILLNFIGKEIDLFEYSDLSIIEVRTWKQWERIDLVVEVDILIDGNAMFFALVIENKLYSNAHNEQLMRYRKIAENFYSSHQEKSHIKLLYYFISCLEEVSALDIKNCNMAGFIPLTYQDLRDSLKTDERTGDSLFDEFWFRYY
jgi:hypothetical protein